MFRCIPNKTALPIIVMKYIILCFLGVTSISAYFIQVPPKLKCPRVCRMYCQFGNVLDNNGCPTCRCKLCDIKMILEGAWIRVINYNVDTAERIIVEDNDIYVNISSISETYKCIDQNRPYSKFLWLNKDGSGYLCVDVVTMFDSVIQYTLLTKQGKFSPPITLGDPYPTLHSLCRDSGHARNTISIRRKYY